ncbi:unnamed protein product [Schistosoma turkestanicum]|nr:unnamed protein product [Schistosoma turkestanicum]
MAYPRRRGTLNNAIVVTFVIEENASIGSEVGRINLENSHTTTTNINNNNNINKQNQSYNHLTFTLQDTTYFNFDTMIPNKLIVCKPLDRDLDRKLCMESGWPEICAWSSVIFVNDGRLLSLRIVIRDVNDNIPKWPTKDHDDDDDDTLDTNQTASDQSILEVWITENSPIGSIIDLPLAYDPDIGENSIVKYEFANIKNEQQNANTTDQLDSRLFQIINLPSPNGLIFQLIINGMLDRETVSMYQFTVAAVDGGGNRGYAKLIIHVADENDNPPIFEFCANHHQNKKKQKNNMNKTELIIGQSSSSSASSCEITASIDEDIPVGSVLPVHSKANDADEGEFGHVTYRFALSAPDVARRDFKIDHETGGIIVRMPLDYDTGGLTQYIFSIVAEDAGQPPLSATIRIIINIQDKNDNSPQITITPSLIFYRQNQTTATTTTTTNLIDSTKSTSLRLIENTPAGALIATITVYDSDSDENGKFTCVLGQTDELNLIYLRNLGKISVYQLSSLRSIDRELQPELRVSLQCEDHGLLIKQKTIELLTIYILDINDNSPKYTNKRYSFQVSETNDIGLLIGELTAMDPDLGLNGQLNYSIHWPSGQGPNPFEINEKGQLITRMPLDRENQPEGYHFIVNALDNGEPRLSGSTHVEIALIDINDCRPAFTQIHYHFSLDEELEMTNKNHNSTTQQSYVIGQVKAMDCDIGLNGQLNYSLDHTMSHPFEITEDGYVTTSKSIDRETYPAFLLQVLAIDNPSKPEKQLTATAQIHITILDINDNEPIFQRPPFDNGTNEVEISYHDIPGHLIEKIEANDKDIGSNGKITYSLIDQNQSINSFFTIRENTGEIFLQKDLTIKEMGTIPLIISATDMGLMPKTTTTTIIIKISDKPTNVFRFNVYNQYSQNVSSTSSLLSHFNMDANKFIIICIILITFIICTVLISVIFVISRHGSSSTSSSNCNIFNKKSTTITKPLSTTTNTPTTTNTTTYITTTTTYNDHIKNGYHSSLLEKSSHDLQTSGGSILCKSINYPFDCRDINLFEQNDTTDNTTNHLPLFYEQPITSITMPSYTFHDMDTRFYDRFVTENDELFNGFHSPPETTIPIQTSSMNLTGTEHIEPLIQNNNNNVQSFNQTTFFTNTNRKIPNNYYSTNTYNTYKFNETLPISHPNRLFDHRNDNNNSIEHSRYSDSITNMPTIYSYNNNNHHYNTMKNLKNHFTVNISHNNDSTIQYPFTASNQFNYDHF